MSNQENKTEENESIFSLGNLLSWGLNPVKAGYSAAGKIILGKALHAAGIMSADEKKQAWVNSVLQQGQNEFNSLKKQGKTIISNQVKLSKDITDLAIMEAYNGQSDSFEDSAGIIRSHFSEFQSILNARQKLDMNDPYAVKAFKGRIQDLVNKLDDIDNAILAIENKICTAPEIVAPTKSHDRVMMENYTDATIMQLNTWRQAGEDISEALFAWYQELRSRMIEWTLVLFEGYVLHINIKNQSSKLDLENNPDDAGLEYLDSKFTHQSNSAIKNLAGTFLHCVERLVISTYRPDFYGPTPSFASQSVINAIFADADLLAWSLLNYNEGYAVDKPKTNPGAFVRKLVGASRLTLDGTQEVGPQLNPGGKLSAETGTVIPIDSRYNGTAKHLTHWYKCADVHDNGNLNSFEEANIRVVRYRWPLSNPNEVGVFVGDSGIFKEMPLIYYYPSTFQPAEDKTLPKDLSTWNGWIYSHYTDFSDLMESKVFNPTDDWNVDISSMEDAGDKRLTDISETHSFQNSPHTFQVKATVVPTLHQDTHRYSAYVRRDFRYLGKTQQFIHVCSSYKAQVQLSKEYSYPYHATIQTSVFLKHDKSYKQPGFPDDMIFAQHRFFDENNPDESYTKSVNLGDLTWDDLGIDGGLQTSLEQQGFQKDGFVMALSPGNTTRLKWNYIPVLESGTSPLRTGNEEYHFRDSSGSYSIDYLRVAWPQPKMNM